MKRRFGPICAAGIALAAGASSASAAGPPFDPADHDWQGCSELFEIARNAVGKDRVVAVTRLDWSELRPNDGLLIIHPERAMDGDRLFAFLDAGGRAAVIDDFGAGDRILERFHIERASPPARPLNALRRNAELAVAEPVANDARVHPSVEGVARVVTNHPTTLRYSLPTPDAPTPVLTIRAIDEPDGVLALAGGVGHGGKLFAMGDPSVLINQMLRYPGNRMFASNLVHYLVQDGGVASDRGKLYVVANHFSETGTFGGPTTVVSAVENLAADLAQSAREFAAGGMEGPLGLALAAALALAVAAWTFRRTSRVHKAVLPVFSRRTPVASQGGASGRAALLSRSHLSSAVALLELKSALEEGLAHELGIEGRTSTDALLARVKATAALDEPGVRALKGILSDMAKVETKLAAGKRIGVRADQITNAASTTFDLLAMAHERTTKRTVT